MELSRTLMTLLAGLRKAQAKENQELYLLLEKCMSLALVTVLTSMKQPNTTERLLNSTIQTLSSNLPSSSWHSKQNLTSCNIRTQIILRHYRDRSSWVTTRKSLSDCSNKLQRMSYRRRSHSLVTYTKLVVMKMKRPVSSILLWRKVLRLHFLYMRKQVTLEKSRH